MKNDLDSLHILRDGANIKRFHTARTLRQQSVGEHSHGVAMIIHAIAPSVRKELIIAALTHDLSEIVTGDTPAPVKWAHPLIAKALDSVELSFFNEMRLRIDLNPVEVHLLKWADMFELLLWAYEETLMGNKYAELLIDRAAEYLEELGHPTMSAQRLFLEWERGRIQYEPSIGDLE